MLVLVVLDFNAQKKLQCLPHASDIEWSAKFNIGIL